jgi:hypothetical protein
MEASCLSRTGFRRRPYSRRCSSPANIILRMKRSLGSLIALTLACTVAATIFGFGSEIFSWRSVYKGLGREELIQATRMFVYIALGVLLALRGGWPGVLAAILMATAATSAEWALFPFGYAWAAVDDPTGYAEKFGSVGRPSYIDWIAYDILGVGISAALAQGLRMMAHANPRGV